MLVSVLAGATPGCTFATNFARPIVEPPDAPELDAGTSELDADLDAGFDADPDAAGEDAPDGT